MEAVNTIELRPAVAAALEEYTAAVRAAFPGQIANTILFGSQATGEARKEPLFREIAQGGIVL